MLKLSTRFVAMLAISTTAVGGLITFAEMAVHGPLNFGIAAIAVLPLLFASRSCGAAWVQTRQNKAACSVIAGYGLWFAILALLSVAVAAMILTHFQKINLPSADNLASFIDRPLDSLSVLALALATCTLITSTGFALGVRAQTQLLPNK